MHLSKVTHEQLVAAHCNTEMADFEAFLYQHSDQIMFLAQMKAELTKRQKQEEAQHQEGA